MTWALYEVQIGNQTGVCSGHVRPIVASRIDAAIDKAVELANQWHQENTDRPNVHDRGDIVRVAETTRPVYVAEEVKNDGRNETTTR